MDRVKSHKPGSGMLGNRYKLNDSLFTGELGALYQARDLQTANPGKTTHVLIHFFPPNILGYGPLRLACEQLQHLGCNIGIPLLQILDCGWSGATPYFVLEAPESWALKSLPAMPGRHSRLHEQALLIADRLLEQNLIQTGLPSQLFLVTPDGGLSLCGTALSRQLQAVPLPKDQLLTPGETLARPATRLPWQLLGLTVASVAAASGLGVYYTLSGQSLTPDTRHKPDPGPTATASDLNPAPVTAMPPTTVITEARQNNNQLITSQPVIPLAGPVDNPLVLSKLDQPNPLASAEMADNLQTRELLAAESQAAVETAPETITEQPRAPLPMPEPESPPEKETQSAQPVEQPAAPLPVPESPPEQETQAVQAAAETRPAAEPEPVTAPEIAEMPEPEPEPAGAIQPAKPPSAEKTTQAAKTTQASRPTPAATAQPTATHRTGSSNPQTPATRPASANIARSDSVPALPTILHQQEPVITYGTPPSVPPVWVKPAPQAPQLTRPPLQPSSPARQADTPPAASKPKPLVPTPKPGTAAEDKQREPELTANGMNSNELVRRAYAAIQKGNLNEQPNEGATYYIRLLNRIDRGNPQILRLAREVVYQYHQRSRTHIQNKSFERASETLWLAARVIKEFNLVRLNASQQVLEHKLASE